MFFVHYPLTARLKNGRLLSFEIRTGHIFRKTGTVQVNKKKQADVLAIVLKDYIIYEPLIEKFDS